MDLDDMAILRPPITKVGNRHYRKLVFEGGQFNDPSNNDDIVADNIRVDSTHDEYEEDEPECVMIEATNNGFRTSLDIAVELVKFICGKKMETKLRIEKETNTQIKLPRPGCVGPVVITGARKKDVLSCRHKIELIMESSRQKIPPTHFLSFPLYNEEIIRRLDEFKSTALETCSQAKGLDASIFQKPQKLHLTIVMLTLLTQNEVDAASSILEECYEDVIRPCVGEEPISIMLKGLEYMNDDPGKVDVLYAKVHEIDGSGRLQKLANELMSYFVTRGMGKDEYGGRIKLHATVINTKLRETDSESRSATRNNKKPPVNSRISLDVREITKVFKDFEFGEHNVDCIHLAQRGVYDDNGQYHCCKLLPLT